MADEIESEEDLGRLGDEKIALGNGLLEALDELDHIDGVAKIKRKIASEISSLQKAISSKRLDINHILCSNLVHFAFLVEVLQNTPNIQSVDSPMKSPNAGKPLRIDVIAENGSEWIKVIARNPKALKDIALGCSNFGSKSILDHAEQYVECAKINQHLFQTPKIVFHFANQIDAELEQELNDLNIEVRINNQIRSVASASVAPITKLNLDVTAMMAYVSSLTCESFDYEFKHNVLNEQAAKEATASTKQFLDDLFKDKELIACDIAKNSFLEILNVVGGPNEKLRADAFLERIQFHRDLTQDEVDSLWTANPLSVVGKIRDRTFQILAFGLHHKALTVTANKGAIEAARQQGMNIPCVIHEARALSEQKQATATYLKRT